MHDVTEIKLGKRFLTVHEVSRDVDPRVEDVVVPECHSVDNGVVVKARGGGELNDGSTCHTDINVTIVSQIVEVACTLNGCNIR